MTIPETVTVVSPMTARVRRLCTPHLQAVALLEPSGEAFAGQPQLPWLTGEVATTSPGDAEVSPTTRRVSTSLAVGIVDVIAGRRPLLQLDGWLDADVARLVERLRQTPGYTELRLRTLRLQFPTSGTVEAALRLGLADESRAAALRIVRRLDGWRVNRLAVALRPRVIARAGRFN